MNREELNAFAHGVRMQRITFGIDARDFYRDVKETSKPCPSITALMRAEYWPGYFREFSRAKVREAIVQKLGVAQSLLIAIGRAYIESHGCIGCRSFATPGLHPWESCKAHDPIDHGRRS